MCEALKELIIDQAIKEAVPKAIAEKDAIIKEKEAIIKVKEAEIRVLKAQLATTSI